MLETPQVQEPLALLPQAQASLAAGVTFSTAAFSQVQCKAASLPQEQVDFLAQTHSAAEQAILISILVDKIGFKDDCSIKIIVEN